MESLHSIVINKQLTNPPYYPQIREIHVSLNVIVIYFDWDINRVPESEFQPFRAKLLQIEHGDLLNELADYLFHWGQNTLSIGFIKTPSCFFNKSSNKGRRIVIQLSYDPQTPVKKFENSAQDDYTSSCIISCRSHSKNEVICKFFFPPVSMCPLTSALSAFSTFGSCMNEFALLPSAPVSDWLSQLTKLDIVWSPRYTEREELSLGGAKDPESSVPDMFTSRVSFSNEFSSNNSHCRCEEPNEFTIKDTTNFREEISPGSSLQRSDMDGIISSTLLRSRPSYLQCNEIQLIRKILCLGTFPLPRGSIYLCPIPSKRFCLDLESQHVDFLKSRHMNKLRGQFRFSVNRVFPEALQLAQYLHTKRAGSTWIDENFIDLMWWFVCIETTGDAKYKEFQILANNAINKDVLSHANEKMPWNSPGRFLDLGGPLSIKKLGPQRDQTITYMCDGLPVTVSANESLNFYPPIKMYCFELWDNHTKMLVASTFTYIIGKIACDFTCVTVIKDQRRCGNYLIKVVADLLKSMGIKLWYWGSCLPYMKAFEKDYGGINIDARDFFKSWMSVGVGCQFCQKSLEFTQHVRVKTKKFKKFLKGLIQSRLNDGMSDSPIKLNILENDECIDWTSELFLCKACQSMDPEIMSQMSLGSQMQRSQHLHHKISLNCLTSIINIEKMIESNLSFIQPINFIPCIPSPLKACHDILEK